MTTTTQLVYGASTAISTTGLGSLASSSTFVAGWESPPVDNSSNKFIDVRVTGNIKVGTTPAASTLIMIYVVPSQTDGGGTPTWPDVFDGTASAETISSAGIGQGFLKRGAALNVDAATTGAVYPFDFSLLEVCNGLVPRNWCLFITHNTGVNLDSTDGNHSISYMGAKYESV
jgi:hypothetical protein